MLKVVYVNKTDSIYVNNIKLPKTNETCEFKHSGLKIILKL